MQQTERRSTTPTRHGGQPHARLRRTRYTRRLSGRPGAHLVSLSVFLAALYLQVAILHTAATREIKQIESPRVEVRQYGDPQEALSRIREVNFTSLRHLNQLASNPSLSPQLRLVYANAPLILQEPGMFSGQDDTPLGVYYRVSITTFQNTTATTIQYYLYFTDENGGTPIRKRMALYGHPFDGELIYEVTFLDNRVLSAYYQAPTHRRVRFPFEGNDHPVFAIASANHNFRLVKRDEGPFAVPLPQSDFTANPFNDPDFVALMAREAILQHGLDVSNYVYLGLQNVSPGSRGLVDVMVRIRDKWYYLSSVIGRGVPLQNYRLVAVPIGFTPGSGSIDEVRIVARPQAMEPEIVQLYIYPAPRVAA